MSIKKYGSGIIFDTTEIGLEKRVLEQGIVQTNFGDLSLAHGVYTLVIPDNTIRAEPIEIFFSQKDANADVDLQILVGKKSHVLFVEKSLVREYSEIKIVIKINDNARVEYIILQNLDKKAYRAASYRARVEKGSGVTWFDMELGGKIVSSDIETKLCGEGATGNTYGMFFGNGYQSFDIHHVTRHLAAHTTSHMETKGLLDNRAKTVYRGLINITKDVYGCDGFEREDTLLLSKDAKVSAVPELEIENNDVKCSHAVTTTHADKEKLFYFESRGIGKDEAVRKLAEGHTQVIIEKIRNEVVRNQIEEMIEKKFNKT